MKALSYTINYERFMEPEFTAPLKFIPDPSWSATIKQMEWYYKVCQLLLNEGMLTHASRLYIRKLLMAIDELPSKPTTRQVNDYLSLTATLCYEMGVTPEQIQKAGVPILY